MMWLISLLNLILTGWVVYQLRPRRRPSPSSPVLDELKKAFGDCGLPVGQFSPTFDLLHSGKLHEVLVHASNHLGNPLVTVDDLRKLLE